MVHILGFPCKDNFLSLLIWIRIKAHFSLKSPFIYSFCLSHQQSYGCHELQKIGKCHQQKVWHLKISHQVNHLCKSRIIVNLVLNLEKLLHLPESKKMFSRLELLFLSYFPKNQLKVLINFLIFHFEIA